MSQMLKDRPSGLGRENFMRLYGGIYEESAWVAQTLFDSGLNKGHDHVEAMAHALKAIVDAQSRDELVALINRHPDLAGRAALAGALSAESTLEQAGAGLDQLTPEELAEFTDLNERYKQKFDFTFIKAVRKATKHIIMQAFRDRIKNDPEVEFATAIAEIHKIARFRLEALAEDS